MLFSRAAILVALLGSALACTNDKPGIGIDDGCSAAAPMCVYWNEWSEIDLGETGDKCWRPTCYDNKANPANKDYGCTNTNPRCMKGGDDADGPGYWCDMAPSGGGPDPAVCTNDEADPTRPDDGCDASAPMCVFNNEQEPDVGDDGDKCWKPTCVDNKNRLNKVDFGCTAAARRCMISTNDARFGGRNGVGNWCADVICLNNRGGNNKDWGCTNAKPLCKLWNGNTPSGQGLGKNAEGFVCEAIP